MSDRERYQQYLCSREWGLLREQVRQRCGGVCERCKSAPMSHVHHLTYIRKYAEHLEDLRGLCEPCHEFTHGKRQRDPMLDMVPRLCDQEIHSVYLAGRLDRSNDWRGAIVRGWRIKHGYGGLGDVLEAQIPDGRSIRYVGPFWRDMGHGDGGDGPHALGDDYDGTEHGAPGTCLISDPEEVASECLTKVSEAFLFFAWIDSREAWGTLVEAGYYKRGNGGVLAVAVPKWDRELWFVSAIADRFIISESAASAWKWMWSNPHLTCRLGSVESPHPTSHVYESDGPVGPDEMQPLDPIEHVDYGRGMILSIDGEGCNRRAVVQFSKCGVRTFLLAKAPLQKV